MQAQTRILFLLAPLVLPSPACGGGGGGGAGAPAGFGAATPGGAGHSVHPVTTLEDSGPGSLRKALDGGTRVVVFDVAGTINLSKPVSVRGPFVTIDGSSSPGPGITIRGAGLRLSGGDIHDVIIRGLRIRNPRADGIMIHDGAHRIWVDHVSIDGCGDGSIDITGGAHDVTVSWSILSGCAKNVLVKWGARRVSFHHNVFVSSRWRNPWLSHATGGSAPDTTADVRNNLVWGWGRNGGGTGVECGARANVVGNFYSSPGAPRNRQELALVLPGCDQGGPGGLLHTQGNVSADPISFDLNSLGNVAEPFPAPPVDTREACQAAASALAGAGAVPRDHIDRNHLNAIRLPC